MKIYDVTLKIKPNMVSWPGDPRVSRALINVKSPEKPFNVSSLSMSVHTGTHVDAPYHIFADGDTIDQLPLKSLFGRTYVQELPDIDLITADVLMQAEIPPRTRRILFKTRNSEYWNEEEPKFHKDFVALSLDAAKYLVKRGVKLVGIDYLSIAPYKNAVEVHETLLGAGVVILEGLNLTGVTQGRYTLYCLPLKIDGADGAPARVILVGI